MMAMAIFPETLENLTTLDTAYSREWNLYIIRVSLTVPRSNTGHFYMQTLTRKHTGLCFETAVTRNSFIGSSSNVITFPRHSYKFSYLEIVL
jgi:hypothetical protein